MLDLLAGRHRDRTGTIGENGGGRGCWVTVILELQARCNGGRPKVRLNPPHVTTLGVGMRGGQVLDVGCWTLDVERSLNVEMSVMEDPDTPISRLAICRGGDWDRDARAPCP